MALTVSCARCHDHKFDPISQMDYYSMAGFFTSTQTHYGTNGGGGNRQASSLMPIGADAKAKEARIAAHNQKLKILQAELGKLQRAVKAKKPKDDAQAEKWLDQKESAKAKLPEMQQEMKDLKNISLPKLDRAMGVRDLGSPRDTHFRVRGDVAQKGPLAKRGFLPVISTNPYPEIPPTQSGRLQFANWIASSDNALTARVTVNRIWKHLYGEGLVRTVDNFGERGERPSNPELLDFLAIRLIENDWSIKQTIREIMLSRSYQLSSAYDEDAYKKDPDNRLFWRMHHRRLDAEALRDSILYVSGKLDLEPGKRSPVEDVGDTNIGQNTKAQALLHKATAKHRSVYQPVVRNLVPPFMTNFDFAEPSIIVGRRNITTVPTQALFMMNSPSIARYSEALAERIIEDEPTDSARRLKRLYHLALSREPQSAERERIFAFIAASGKEDELHDWTLVAQSVIASAEFRYLE
jgi:hypothetical protein